MAAAEPQPHPAALPADALLADCQLQLTRRAGPGGQHRNKVSTAVVLRHRPTGVRAEAGERRSQAQNRAVALRRLRIQLALAIRRADQDRRPPSLLWQQRCRNGKISVSPAHEDFPALLAEALDHLHVAAGHSREAADRLGVSGSQLVKFLKLEPRALQQLNELRARHDLPPLK